MGRGERVGESGELEDGREKGEGVGEIERDPRKERKNGQRELEDGQD